MPPFYTYISSGAPSFTGLLDNLNSTPFYAFSVRRLTGNNWGVNNPLLRLRRSSDNEEADFSYDNNNEFSVNSISFNSSSGTTNGQLFSNWKGVSDTYVVTIYDQSGNNRDATSPTSTEHPLLIVNGINSKPSIYWANSEALTFVSSLTYINSSLLVSNVVDIRSANAGITWVGGNAYTSNNNAIFQVSTNNRYIHSSGIVRNTARKITFGEAVMSAVVNQTSSTLDFYENNQLTSNTFSSFTNFEVSSIGNRFNNKYGADFYESENILTLNLNDLTTIRNSQSSYYGITI